MAIKEIFEQNTADIALATELLKELSDREGEYVWKKCGYLTLTWISGSSTGGANFQVECEGVNLSAINASFFVGLTGTYTVDTDPTKYPFSFENETTINMGGNARSFTYNPTTAQINIAIPTDKRLPFTLNDYVFIDYVVSSDSNAYPDGGEQDGYYYELISEPVDLAKELDLIPENIRQGIDIFGVIGAMSEGVSGIDYGTVTTATYSTNPITISHGLDVTPTKAVLIHISSNGSNDFVLIRSLADAFDGQKEECYVYKSGSSIKVSFDYEGQHITFDSKNVTFTPVLNFTGTYLWIVIV